MTADLHSMNDHILEDDFVLIPDGEHELQYLGHKTWLYMGRSPKIVVTFQIVSSGEHHGKIVFAYYNAMTITGKPRKNGRFTVGWRSDFMMDYATCFGKPLRRDRISMQPFRGQTVIGRLRTVTKNRDQRNYPDGLQYSVVDELTGIKT
jgi:hypothetical protein